MSLNQYQQLLTPVNEEVEETEFPYQFVTERHLHALWYEQRYFENLTTLEGHRVEVISPGIWNFEAGPDFLKASILIDGKKFNGDIEIHLNDESWYHHKHHTSTRYDNVVLHLSLWQPKKEATTVENSLGQTIPQAYFEPALTVTMERLLKLIDLDLYPYQHFLGSGKCAQSLFVDLPENEITSLLQNAAEWRLANKWETLKSRVEASNLRIGAGIALALGYKSNSETFFELFFRLLKFRHLEENQILSLALGSCGFFVEHYQKKWCHSLFYQQLNSHYEQLSSGFPFFYTISSHQVRPFNHPVRRLAYLAKLIKEPKLFQLEEIFRSIWESKPPHLLRELFQALPDYEDAYWNSHYTFEKEPREQHLALMGDSLKKEIFTNTIFPMLLYRNANPEKVLEIFSTFTAPIKGKSRYLNHRFFGDTAAGHFLKTAPKEQGAFQLHKDFCIHHEASCEGCPFVERYKKFFVKTNQSII